MTKRIDEIGALFLKRRRELGITQEQLGEKVGVKKSEISKIENGRSISISTVNKMTKALGVKAEIKLVPEDKASEDIIHYIIMCLGLFARKHGLTRKEACNYLARFQGLRFVKDNYEAEHQLSLNECVTDMTEICKRNGGGVQ